MIPDPIKSCASRCRLLGWVLFSLAGLILAGCATGSETRQSGTVQATLAALAVQTYVPHADATAGASPSAPIPPSPAPGPRILPARSPSPAASPPPVARAASSPEARPCSVAALVRADTLWPAVFEVAATDLPGGSTGRGTAFGIRQVGDRTILATSAHLVRGADSIEARNSLGSAWLDADVIVDLLTTSPGVDVAFLSVPGRYPILPLSRAGGPDSPIAVPGFGPGQARYATGEVEEINRDAAGRARLLRLSVGLESGDSGSPVLDACGAAIGVATNIPVGGASDVSYAEAWEGFVPLVEDTGQSLELSLTGVAR